MMNPEINGIYILITILCFLFSAIIIIFTKSIYRRLDSHAENINRINDRFADYDEHLLPLKNHIDVLYRRIKELEEEKQEAEQKILQIEQNRKIKLK